MTDMSKYRNVSLSKETYKVLEKLSKLILPDAKLSVSKTIEAIKSNPETCFCCGELKDPEQLKHLTKGAS